MARYKLTIYNSSNHNINFKVIGTYNSHEDAVTKGCEYAFNRGMTSSCEKREDIIDALTNRDFYMLAYGPRELEIEEVMT